MRRGLGGRHGESKPIVREVHCREQRRNVDESMYGVDLALRKRSVRRWQRNGNQESLTNVGESRSDLRTRMSNRSNRSRVAVHRSLSAHATSEKGSETPKSTGRMSEGRTLTFPSDADDSAASVRQEHEILPSLSHEQIRPAEPL